MALCDVCQKNEAVGVCCVPGAPISMAYCRECLEANAHPWGILVAQVAMCGGYEHVIDEYREMIECTIKHLGKTREQFDADVAADIRALDEYSKGS